LPAIVPLLRVARIEKAGPPIFASQSLGVIDTSFHPLDAVFSASPGCRLAPPTLLCTSCWS